MFLCWALEFILHHNKENFYFVIIQHNNDELFRVVQHPFRHWAFSRLYMSLITRTSSIFRCSILMTKLSSFQNASRLFIFYLVIIIADGIFLAPYDLSQTEGHFTCIFNHDNSTIDIQWNLYCSGFSLPSVS